MIQRTDITESDTDIARLAIAAPVLPATVVVDDEGVRSVAPAEICPELLTEEEAIRFLRLDTIPDVDARKSLERYRQSGKLRSTRIGRRLMYHIDELRRFIASQTEGAELE